MSVLYQQCTDKRLVDQFLNFGDHAMKSDVYDEFLTDPILKSS